VLTECDVSCNERPHGVAESALLLEFLGVSGLAFGKWKVLGAAWSSCVAGWVQLLFCKPNYSSVGI
jgi:hypothetical protein